MLRMIREIVACLRMGEDGEAVAIQRKPLSECTDGLGQDRQLAATTRVRPDRPCVEASDRNAELLPRRSRKLLRPIELVGIEIDVRMEVADAAGHAALYHRRA